MVGAKHSSTPRQTRSMTRTRCRRPSRTTTRHRRADGLSQPLRSGGLPGGGRRQTKLPRPPRLALVAEPSAAAKLPARLQAAPTVWTGGAARMVPAYCRGFAGESCSLVWTLIEPVLQSATRKRGPDTNS